MKTKLRLLFFSAVLAIASLCFCLTACNGGKDLTFAAPENVKYDGAMITWDAVKNAEKYIVKVNDGAEISVNTNSFGYAANGTQFIFTVKADAESSKLKKAEETSVTFSYIGKVEDSAISIDDDGKITWDAITGATAYEVKNGTEINVIYQTEYQIPVGSIDFQVRPTIVGDNTKYSVWSTVKKVTKCGVLEGSKISYDGTYITFDAVSGAQKYELSIDGQPVEELLTSRKYAYDAKDEDFSVSIRAIGNHSSTFDGEACPDKKFVFLDMVTGLKVSDGILYWDGDETKTYSLKINNSTVEVKGNHYSGELLTTGTSLSVQIKEISTDSTYFSSYTVPMSAYILPAPTLTWSQLSSLDGGENSLSWNAVSGAAGYTVTVVRPDGTTVPNAFGNTQGAFSYDYDAVGTYTVTIVATADEGDGVYSSSKASSPFTVIRPGRPEKLQNGFIRSNDKSLADGFTVTCKTQSSDYRYKLYKNGTQDGEISSAPQFVRKNLVKSDVIDGQEDTYSIQIIGRINSENRVTLNSRELLDFKITILAMPQNVRMNGFMLQYDSVANAENNYWITGVNGGSGTEGTANGADLTPYIKSGAYNMQVCAKGNGSDVLASNYSTIVKVFRLGAPSNVRIDTNTAENGILKYDISSMATGIELYLGSKDATQKVESTANVLENMNDQIKEGGTYVSLVAVGNYKAEDGVYYITSEKSTAKEFVKIAAPSNLTFDNTHLKWNQTGVSEAQVGSITYEIYNESGVLFTATQNDREVDISKLAGGRTYVFSIRAIGDGNRYINSESSQSASVYKLNAPIVKRADGNFVWGAITNASSYSVTVDGRLFDTAIHQSGEKYAFDPVSAFEQIKTYRVTITAVGNGGIGELKTISSEPVVIEQKVVQLAKPEFSISYDKDYYDAQGNIVVTITKEVPYASGYRYTFNGITRELTGEGSTVYKYNPNNTGAYQIYVNALGGMFDEEGNYTIVSPIAGGQNSVLTLLATPDKNSIKINKDGYVSFAAIAGADEYELEFYVNGSSEAIKVTVITNGFDFNYEIVQKDKASGIKDYSEVRSLKVVVRAVAKTSNKVSSQQSDNEWSGNLH